MMTHGRGFHTLVGSALITIFIVGTLSSTANGQTRIWERSLQPSTGLNSDCDTAIFDMPAPLAPDEHFDFIGLYNPNAAADGPDRDATPLTPADCQSNLDALIATTSNAAFRAANGFPEPDSRLKNLLSNEVPKPAQPNGYRLFLPPEGVLPPPFPPTNSIPNAPLTLGEFRNVSGDLHLSCFDDGTAEVQINLDGYTPNEVLTVWAIWLTTPPGAPGPAIVPLPLGGVPNVIIPDDTGAATFVRTLGHCPMDAAPDGSQILVLDIASHWDGSAYGAIPDVPFGEATFLPDPTDPSSAFNSVIGAGIVTVNRGVIPMTVTGTDPDTIDDGTDDGTDDGGTDNPQDCNMDGIFNGADIVGVNCP